MEKTLSVKDLDLEGKKALIRVDFNVPMTDDGRITDDTRIVASLPTIQYVLNSGGSCILMSHLGRPKGKSPQFSLAPCAEALSKLIHKKVIMAPDTIGDEVEKICHSLTPGSVVLLENVRFYEAEEQPEKDPSFAKNLAKLADVYINDAFGSAHRAHSSTVDVARYFPHHAASGFLMEKEIEFLGSTLASPRRPFYGIIGGAKISTKLGVLSSLIHKVDALFIGGAMAYTFLQAQGISVGKSLCEEAMVGKAKAILQLAKEKNIPLFLPEDIVCTTSLKSDANISTVATSAGVPADLQGVDIGAKTTDHWLQELKKAKTILWNGPLGIFEDARFAQATFAIANGMANLHNAITIIGGGDSASAVQAAGCASRITHISTGGGASLEYIEFGSLPGVDALSHT